MLLFVILITEFGGKNMKLKKKYLFFSIVGILIVAILGIFGYEYQKIQSTANTISTNHSLASRQQLKQGKPFSILVLGTDVGALGRGTSYAGNTDTLELITVNPKKQNISYIFQGNSTMPWLTVEQNVAFGLDIKKVDKEKKEELVNKYLEIVGLAEFRKYYPKQLSTSMLQRVSIARAFVTEPELLLMDEPYGQLDMELRFHLEDELIRLWEMTGTTVIFITHNIEEAVYLSSRIMILTNKPTSVKRIMENTLPRPRDISSPDFVNLRNEVTELIKWW